jgi:hypothetical protein
VRWILAAAVAAATVAATTAGALAHEGNPDYRSEVSGIVPNAPGVEIEMLNFDDSLELANRGDATVVVEGYDEEPYLRFSPDGKVEVNTRSPAYFLNDDRYADVEVPATADAKAKPVWQRVAATGAYSWHDHRAHYMGTGIPQQVSDQSVRTKVFDYTVPLEVDGRPAAIEGTLYWAGDEDGGPPVAALIGLGAFVVICVAGVIVVRLRRRGEPDGVTDGETGEAW